MCPAVVIAMNELMCEGVCHVTLRVNVVLTQNNLQDDNNLYTLKIVFITSKTKAGPMIYLLS